MPDRQWIELALDYRCNLRCLGCRACDDNGEQLTPSTALEILREARQAGISQLWIGGGEPTLRPELPALIVRARSMGFDRVLLQTNGLRLSYRKYADAIIDAGVTDLSFNVKSHRAETNDRLTRTVGSYGLLCEGIANALGRARLGADVLLTRSTAPDLAETVRGFAGRGIGRFTLWLLSAADGAEPMVLSEVPTFTELAGPIRDAIKVANELTVELFSLHTPPCVLPADQRHRYLPASSLKLVVVDPSRRSFPLESSPFEGGTFPPTCSRCASRTSCGGAREDYVRLHGSEELIPLQGALRDPSPVP